MFCQFCFNIRNLYACGTLADINDPFYSLIMDVSLDKLTHSFTHILIGIDKHVYTSLLCVKLYSSGTQHYV